MRGSKYEPRVAELNREAARLARQAAGTGNQVLVGGSMGPLGQLLKPYGPIERDDAESAYAEQAGALASGGVDLIAIETQYSLEEATAAIAGARSVTDLPIMVSFSYDRGTRTMMGLRPRAAMHLVEAGGIAMIGVNCGTTLENAVQVLSEYHATLPGFPLWAKPNAGLPRVEAGRTVFDVTPDGMTQFAERAVELGALVVGGCCGSTPAHLRAIARAVGARQVTGRLA
jgi:5-methyltetrahydrofolate--homocysteine methyltransferase